MSDVIWLHSGSIHSPRTSTPGWSGLIGGSLSPSVLGGGNGGMAFRPLKCSTCTCTHTCSYIYTHLLHSVIHVVQISSRAYQRGAWVRTWQPCCNTPPLLWWHSWSTSGHTDVHVLHRQHNVQFNHALWIWIMSCWLTRAETRVHSRVVSLSSVYLNDLDRCSGGSLLALALPDDRGGLPRIGVSNKRITDILCWDAAVLTVSWVLSQCFSLLLLLNLRRCSLKLSFQSLPLLPEILRCSSSVCAPLSCFVDSPSSVSRLCFNLLLPWTSVSQ